MPSDYLFQCADCGHEQTRYRNARRCRRCRGELRRVDQMGLYGKYIVNRSDGQPVDPGADYFVLRLDTDEAARRALLVYAWLVVETMPKLSQDLRERLGRYDKDVER